MEVHLRPNSYVVGQPINPVSWPRKFPKPIHINTNTQYFRRPASADSSRTDGTPSPVSPRPHSATSSLPPTPNARESEVPRAVSRLIALTKQLQDVLALWARRQAGEAEVSDAFVLIGSQFDSTVHAFWRVGVDMSDLYDVPLALRAALENLLASRPSPEVLARHQPAIRTALFALLVGLRDKQAPYWAAVGRNASSPSPSSLLSPPTPFR